MVHTYLIFKFFFDSINVHSIFFLSSFFRCVHGVYYRATQSTTPNGLFSPRNSRTERPSQWYILDPFSFLSNKVMYNIFTIHPNWEGCTQRKIIINNTRNDAFVVYQLLFCHQLTKYKIQKYRFEKFVTYGEFFNHNENIVIKVGNRIKIRAPQRMVMTFFLRFPQFSF